MSQRASPLSTFTPLNQSVFLHTPSSSPSPTPSSDPDVIIFHGWMGATPQHISKYTSTYITLFPTSPIIAVTTSLKDCMFSSTSQNVKRIEPVLSFLRTLQASRKTAATNVSSKSGSNATPPPPLRILLHTFSNGGGYTTTLLLRTFKASTGYALPVHAMVLDSSPGKATFKSVINAMAVSLPANWVAQFFGRWLLRLGCAWLFFWYAVSRRPDWITKMSGEFLDSKLIPLDFPVPPTSSPLGPNSKSLNGLVGAEKGRRVYVYSKEDDMVHYGDVEEHAAEAAARGWVVELEMFEGSKHAAHVRLDPDRYWGAVRRVWDGSRKA